MERWVTCPNLGPPNYFITPVSDNQYARLLVPAGIFKIDYRADVTHNPLIINL